MEITNNLSEKALYDYKIVRNAIAGDEKAYGELFKRYKDSVYFMILKMVNNRTDAEDLMFEAFEKAFASLNYYSPQFAFSTWLFKIASNNTIDFIRKRKAQTVSLDVDDINPEDRGYINSIPADVRTPDEEAIRQQRADFMREKVALGIGVGTQSVDAYKMLRMRRRVKNQKEWLNPNEIDLLKKIYYLKKKEKQDN